MMESQLHQHQQQQPQRSNRSSGRRNSKADMFISVPTENNTNPMEDEAPVFASVHRPHRQISAALKRSSNKQQTKFANIPNRRYNGDGMCGGGRAGSELGADEEMNNENKIIYETHSPSGIPIHSKSQQPTNVPKQKRGLRPMPVPPLRNGSNISQTQNHTVIVPPSQAPQQIAAPNHLNQISISKTATHLLNGIYEKNLLSQTSFDQYNNAMAYGGKQQMPQPQSNQPLRNLNNRQPPSHSNIYEFIGPSKPVGFNNAPELRQSVPQPPDPNDSTLSYELINNVLSPEILKYFQSKALMNATKPGGSTTEENKYQTNRINVMLETAQALATAAYLERAAQRMTSAGNNTRSRSTDMTSSDRGGYCGALQRSPPPMPAALTRRLINRENMGFGKVKVMLKVSDNPPSEETAQPSCLSIDKKKRQVTLTESNSNAASVNAQERGPMVSAPKMFAFDSLFTAEDPQSDICSSSLSEIIPAVLEGSDGCLLTLGYPGVGQTKTMFGSLSSGNDLGAIPCAISWLYRGINEKRQKSGARFSVRVSALGVNATKPGSQARDLLAAHATESDESPGMYLRDDYLGGPTELRAPTAERAALFLDAALAGRTHGNHFEPALIFTLHVYQYSLAGRGGVAGGRSRLHLIDLGGCANRSGGLPLSGIGNVLLSILSGQRHPPNRDHPLTPLLKDCLAPLTCHVAILAHVSHAQTHTDALTTIQLASRIHRMRRRKHRFPLSNDKNIGLSNATGNNQSGSSEGPDPSSSDLSADTVIYMGPCDDATDGEHPPVYLPSLSSGDNRCAMGKALRGSAAEKPNKSPMKKLSVPQKAQSPVMVPHQRTDSLKRNQLVLNHVVPPISSDIILTLPQSHSSPKIVAGAFKHAMGVSKGSNIPTPKGSPLRRANHGVASNNSAHDNSSPRVPAEEKWIDGPRVSRTKVVEARHLLREINHVKKCETWIDGPKTLNATVLPPTTSNQNGSYGFMDSHKKTMIRQWVENQSSQIFQGATTTAAAATVATVSTSTTTAATSSPQRQIVYQYVQCKPAINEEDKSSNCSKAEELINPIHTNGFSHLQLGPNSSESCVRTGLCGAVQEDNHSEKSTAQQSQHNDQQMDGQEEEDQDSGPSEVPPALPLIEQLKSREISHESVHIMCSRHVSRESLSLNHHNIAMMDCGLQVNEEDIARTMGEHPLAALSHGDVSVVSSFNVGDAFSDCVLGDTQRNQFDQLARLREIFTSQLAMAEVTPFRLGDAASVYSEPAYRFAAGPGSVCSEPVYRAPSPSSRCRGCRQSIALSRTPSQNSLPSLNGIVAIAGMDQYASLRHPDGASDPNLQKIEGKCSSAEKDQMSIKENPLDDYKDELTPMLQQTHLPQLPLLPISTPEAYDSGHDSTPRTSKHSGISRRAESGYHSVGTVRDSDESSFGSAGSRANAKGNKKRNRSDKSLCHWLRNPFTCTYPDTEGEVSDF